MWMGNIRGVTPDFTTEPIAINAPLTIGGYLYGTSEGEYFKGAIDDISIHDRVLSLEEIAANYHDRTPARASAEASNVLSIQVMNHESGLAGLMVSPELILDHVVSDRSSPPGYLQPTPVGPNGPAFPGVAESPVFSRTKPIFDEPFLLTMTGSSPDAEIRYTLDGTPPDETSLLYTEPLQVDQPVVISARQYVENLLPGRIAIVGFLDAPVLINEFLAINTTVNPDNVDLGDYSDWIELHNTSQHAVDFSLFGLTDDPTRPFKWRFPVGTILEPGGFLLVWADGENAFPGQRVQRDYSPYDSVFLKHLHVGFQLSGAGETVALFSPNGELLDQIDYSTQMTDVSAGRTSPEKSDWAWFAEPTPGRANTSTALPIGASSTSSVAFSTGGGIFVEPLTLSLTTPSTGAVIRFTLDGSKPTSSSPIHDSPILIEGSTVVRAKAFEEGKLPGAETVQVYIFDHDSDLPIVSVAAYPDTLFGRDIGIFRNNFKKRAVPTHIDFYDRDTGGEFHVDAGLKLVGFVIQQLDQKPMSIELDDRWGAETLDYQLFEDREFTAFTEFLLRPGGQDGDKTFLREGMVNTVIRDTMDIEYQAYRPVRLYLNGEYYGLYNIREKQDLDYIHLNHPEVDGRPVDFLEHDVRPAVLLEGTHDAYTELIAYLETADMSLDSSYAHAGTLMDINEFINHQIVSLYIGRWSPDHNMKFWREIPDGRFRWLVMDVDQEWGGIYPASFETLEYVTDPAGRRRAPTWASVELRKLLENPTFRDVFLQRFAAHIAITFDPDRVESITASLKEAISSEMPHQIARWPDRIPTMEKWEQNVSVLNTYSRQRPSAQRAQLIDYFGLEGTASISVRNSTPELGDVLIQDVIVPPSFSGDFFKNLPLSIEAIPRIGARFEGWSNGEVSPVLILEPGEDVWLEPVFSSEETARVIPTTIVEPFVLTASDTPWLTTGTVTVVAGASLTIEPGVNVLMPDGASIIVRGGMEIQGTTQDPVTIGPNPARSARSPLYIVATGDHESRDQRWGAMVFDHPDAPIVLRHLEIRGASNEPSNPMHKGAITAIEADIVMENLLLDDVRFRIFVEGGEVVLRDSVIHASAVSDGINVKRARSALVERCEFVGSESFDTDAIDYDGISNGRILNNRVHGFTGFNSDGIDLGEGSSDVLIEGNIIRDCNDKGVSVGQGSTIILRRNIIHECGQGIGIKDTGSYALIDQNTFYGNATGIAIFEKNIGAGGGSATVVNCVLSASSDASIFVDALSEISISHSISDTELLEGHNNLFADPMLANPSDGDFRLQTASPAIDAGSPDAPSDPDNTPADLGAIPFVEDFEVPTPPSLVITEIHYNPSQQYGSDEALEFVEILNTGTAAVSLEGFSISEGIEFEFPAGSVIAESERIVVARSATTYADSGYAVFQWSSGALANEGERITLVDDSNLVIDSVAYGTRSPWPDEPDGNGPSLAIVDPTLPNDQPGNWRSSFVSHGTPGLSNWTRPTTQNVSLEAGNFHISWRAITGLKYQIEFTENLTSPEWHELGPPEIASEDLIDLIQSVSEDLPQRFYRLNLIP